MRSLALWLVPIIIAANWDSFVFPQYINVMAIIWTSGWALLGCWPRQVLCYHRIVVIESKLTFVLEFLDEMEIAGGNIDT